MGLENEPTDKIFWSSAIALSFLGLLYFIIQSYVVTRSINVLVLGIIFMSMWVGALALGFWLGKDFDILNYGTLFGNASWFLIGFAFYVGINLLSYASTGQLSVFSVSTNSFYSTVASEIPRNIDFLFTVFIIPIVEELLWIFGIPAMILTVMNATKNKIKLFGNPVFQLIVTVVICAGSFAIFHAGKIALLGFVISAIIFRTVTIVAVYSDWGFDVFKKLAVVPALALGMHIGNNFVTYGISEGIELLNANFFTTGWLVYGIFGFLSIVVLNGVGQKIKEWTE
jgi:hypothetical protein